MSLEYNSPRGWKASELAEKSVIGEPGDDILHSSALWFFMAVAVFSASLVVLWSTFSKFYAERLKYRNVAVRVDSNDEPVDPVDREQDDCDLSSDSAGACSCSNASVSPYKSSNPNLVDGYEEEENAKLMGKERVEEEATSMIQAVSHPGRQGKVPVVRNVGREDGGAVEIHANSGRLYDLKSRLSRIFVSKRVMPSRKISPQVDDEPVSSLVHAVQPHASDESDLISQKIGEAAATLSSISSRLPEDMPVQDKMTMTQMILKAMKVNESCRATYSMQKMEGLARERNELEARVERRKMNKYREEACQREASSLLKTNADVLYSGIMIMLFSAIYSAWYKGVLWSHIYSCFDGRHVVVQSSWSMLQNVSVMASIVQCASWRLMQAIQTSIILVITPVVVSRLGLLREYHVMPVFKLGSALSILCGLAGFWAIRSLDGNATTWLVLWELWVLMHIIISLSSRKISELCTKGVEDASGSTQPRDHSRSITGSLWVFGGLVLPATMGYCAFLP